VTAIQILAQKGLPNRKLNTHVYLQKQAYNQASSDSKWHKCLIFPTSHGLYGVKESDKGWEEQHYLP
jgi:hypothetical protein